MRLILASASPRRAELLSAAGFTFEVLPTDVDEQVRPGETPVEYVRRLASEKSLAALHVLGTTRTNPPAGDVLIIGADTAVIVDEEILGKPADDADAARMLVLLSGRAHRVLTGVSVRSADREVVEVDESLVFVRRLSPDEVRWYVESGEGRDKAGGYGIQGLASRFIPRIEGSYSNVVGLPVARVSDLLKRFRG